MIPKILRFLEALEGSERVQGPKLVRVEGLWEVLTRAHSGPGPKIGSN